MRDSHRAYGTPVSTRYVYTRRLSPGRRMPSAPHLRARGRLGVGKHWGCFRKLLVELLRSERRGLLRLGGARCTPCSSSAVGQLSSWLRVACHCSLVSVSLLAVRTFPSRFRRLFDRRVPVSIEVSVAASPHGCARKAQAFALAVLLPHRFSLLLFDQLLHIDVNARTCCAFRASLYCFLWQRMTTPRLSGIARPGRGRSFAPQPDDAGQRRLQRRAAPRWAQR